MGSEPISYTAARLRRLREERPPQHPDNAEYMSGWVAGWGVTDAYCGEPALFPQDEDYMKGFNIVWETMTKAAINFM